MPTRSPRRRESARHGLALVAGLVSALFGSGAAAHDLTSDPLPDSPGWRVGAAAAVSWAHSQHTWPAPRWPGFPGSGQTPSSREGASLEHATLDAAATIGDRYGAYLAFGQHGSDQPHTEAARVEGRWRLDLDTLAVQLGRDRVPMGSALTSAGHLDRYAQPPLIKRIALNDDWIDDGLNLRWQRGRAEGLQSVDLGLWTARTYPGGSAGRPSPAAHLQAGWGDVSLDLFGAALSPRDRGMPGASLSAGHTHNQPDCRTSLVGVVCFDGQTRLLGASLSWDPHDWLPVTLTLAGLLQRDSGALRSLQGGTADYRGTTSGGWLDVVWQIDARWSLGVRAERVSASHDVTGPGASLIVTDAGLSPNQPLQRLTGGLTWQPAAGWQLSAEAGSERGTLPGNRWMALRAIWSAPDLIGGRW
ncbi:MAG: hypothetical protein RLY71_3966 [Pseudomonadota bacterium]|jgi:hypothetical protein